MNKEFSILDLRRTIELHDFVIKTEKNTNKTSFTKIFLKNKVLVSTSAIVWNKNNYKSYKKYFSQYEFSLEEFSSKKESKGESFMNHTVQRDAILKELRMNHEHPTADKLYENLRKKLPIN